MHTFFAYKRNGVEGSCSGFSRYELESIDDKDPEDSETPKEFLALYKNAKRISLEAGADAAVSQWYDLASKIEKNEMEIRKCLRQSGIDHTIISNCWLLESSSVFVRKYFDLKHRLHSLIYGNDKDFKLSDLYLKAPETAKENLEALEETQPFLWLKNFFLSEAEQKNVTKIRILVKPSSYNTFSKDEAKIVVAAIRDKFVRNSEDSISDLAKVNNFLVDSVSFLFDFVPKENLSQTDLYNMESITDALGTLKKANSRFTKQYKEDGINLVRKLAKREEEISEIIEMVYSNIKG
jgi:hypothetical protein